MNRFSSKIHGNPSELEYYANKTEYGLYEMLKEKRERVCERNKEFEIARNVERKLMIDNVGNSKERSV